MNYSRFLPFFALLIVYLVGAFYIDIMDIDAAQYASIGREMADNNQFLDVQFRGTDYYLDKPPLLFWVTALIAKVFGATNFAYRLVPLLSTFLGIYAIYRFCKLYYSEQTAYIAALIMGSCQAFFLMNHDVRCDTLLTNCVTVSIWQIAEYLRHRRWTYFVGGFVFAGLGMLAKGPIALIVVGTAFFVDFVLKRQWKQLFDPRWLLGALIIGIVLIPYCIGLYGQYGQHGLYFFFWEQSFGRITGENEWANSPGLLFQAQNFLWSFLPWVLVFVPALFSDFQRVWKQRFRLDPSDEAISLGGFFLPFAALSTAQYQLPHYTFVVFPLAAVISARYLSQLIDSKSPSPFRWVRGGLIFTAVVMALAILLISVWAFPLEKIVLIIIVGMLTVLIVRLFGQKRPRFSQLVFAPFLVAIAANLIMNGHFYPSLLRYQIGSVVGNEIADNYSKERERFFVYDLAPVTEYNIFNSALDFYTERTTPTLRSLDELKGQSAKAALIYTDEQGLTSLKSSGLRYEILRTYQNFHVTGLTLPFLNPATRSTETHPRYLVRLN
ncbi:glycosyltransferase family 39 protein [Runella sp.]|jgi:4-amino-4-deoxy-L-arabinose transferase-like glycosyltransferase|uniref:ArnT family glycosyltransferase n=1 Tax=Runella sp. TaxID=1960881 RepID=UPI0026289BDE|nr:glycosyltransferase family 39 protein [Runella sp.]